MATLDHRMHSHRHHRSHLAVHEPPKIPEIEIDSDKLNELEYEAKGDPEKFKELLIEEKARLAPLSEKTGLPDHQAQAVRAGRLKAETVAAANLAVIDPARVTYAFKVGDVQHFYVVEQGRDAQTHGQLYNVGQDGRICPATDLSPERQAILKGFARDDLHNGKNGAMSLSPKRMEAVDEPLVRDAMRLLEAKDAFEDGRLTPAQLKTLMTLAPQKVTEFIKEYSGSAAAFLRRPDFHQVVADYISSGPTTDPQLVTAIKQLQPNPRPPAAPKV